MPIREMPDTLPTDVGSLDTLIDTLEWNFLENEGRGFAYPSDVIEAMSRLRYFRLSGKAAADGTSPPAIPETFLSGMLAAGSAFAFIVLGNGNEAEFYLGGTEERSAHVRNTIESVFGNVHGGPDRIPAGSFDAPSLGCLSGTPAPSGSGEQGRLPMDLLLDSLRETPFVFAVFATPENIGSVREDLSRFRESSQQLDRVMLQTDQPNTHGTARQALDLLERHRNRLRDGSSRGMWRVSLCLGTPDPGTTGLGLSVLLGCWKSRDGKSFVPLRAHLLQKAEPADGYPVHSNRYLPDEVAAVCALPNREIMGFRIRRRTDFDVDHVPPEGEHGISFGKIMSDDRDTGHQLVLPVRSLTRHALVAGMTGSGKTNSVKELLVELSALEVPFLVMEPAKSEYSLLADKVKDLLFFRVGAPIRDGEIPFQFNPFTFPQGFPLHTHIDYLKCTFIAGFGLYPPAPFLLETALNRVYEQRGWNLATGTHPHPGSRLAYPTLSDLLALVEPIVEEAGYDVEITRNLKGALKTRIGNLCSGPKGMMLDTRENMPDKVLFETPAVLEMKDLGSDQEKALVMGFVLTRLYEYREMNDGDGEPRNLRHLLVIEEAHRLLKRAVEKSSEEINMQGQAVETFTNMLSEIRAYGQGVMVVEQIPSKVAVEVVKNSATKVVHRLPASDDQELVGDTMNLTSEQKRHLAVLRKGWGVVHGEEMDGAIAIRFDRACHPVDIPARTFSERLARMLPEVTRRRLAYHVTKWKHSSLLKDEAMVKAADGSLIRLIVEEDAEAVVRELREEVENAMTMTGQADHLGTEIGEMLEIVVSEAVLRRAVHYGWLDEDLSSVMRSFHSGANAFAESLAETLGRGRGAMPACSSCRAQCLFGYEGLHIADTAGCIEELQEVLADRGDENDLVDDIDRLINGWVGGEFDLEHEAQPPSLKRCVLARALTRLGIGKRKIEPFLSVYMKRMEECS